MGLLPLPVSSASSEIGGGGGAGRFDLFLLRVELLLLLAAALSLLWLPPLRTASAAAEGSTACLSPEAGVGGGGFPRASAKRLADRSSIEEDVEGAAAVAISHT